MVPSKQEVKKMKMEMMRRKMISTLAFTCTIVRVIEEGKELKRKKGGEAFSPQPT